MRDGTVPITNNILTLGVTAITKDMMKDRSDINMGKK